VAPPFVCQTDSNRAMKGKAKKIGEKLILFTRYPEPGRTKTRLISALGPQGAADLQRVMTEHTVWQARQLTADRGVDLEIRYEGGDAAGMRQWLCAPEFVCRPQQKGTLGERMEHAFAAAFQSGMKRVVVVGCDCPALSSRILAAALDSLIRYDMVLGPALDGGYYLIGLSRFLPEVFADISWGSADVFSRTLARVHKLNISTLLLESLSDVDRPEDLLHFHRHSNLE